MKGLSESALLSLADQLAQNEFIVVDDFLDEATYAVIHNYFLKKLGQEAFHKAAVGNINPMIVTEKRGDFSCWLDREEDAELVCFFEVLDELIFFLKRNFFLSINDEEFHFAHYPPGAHYEKHLDSFKEASGRLISVVIYLNEGWEQGDGGELEVFHKDGTSTVVEPIKRRAVIFKSDSVEHQVLATGVNRYSLTGWLLHKNIF